MTRQKLIALVHIGSAVAFADEAARRAWQRAKTGKTSCREMTDAQLQRLVDELRAKGALNEAPPRRAGRRPANADREPYLAKIGALLADMGLSWQYAEAIAWRVTGGKGGREVWRDGVLAETDPGVPRLEWVRSDRDWRAIVAALAVEQEKRILMGRIAERLAVLGKDLAWCDQYVTPSRRGPKWQRNRADLRVMVEVLDAAVAESKSKEEM